MHQAFVVSRAEAYLRAHIGTRVSVARLSRVVGVSERSLRNAFYAVHGMGPKRWMLVERLAGVHRVLREDPSRAVKVTDVASDYGFSELGRFAVSYREAFGESPSATLRGSLLKSPSITKGHAHA
jgi:transcriptional regulator GlxA family with amidase domain